MLWNTSQSPSPSRTTAYLLFIQKSITDISQGARRSKLDNWGEGKLILHLKCSQGLIFHELECFPSKFNFSRCFLEPFWGPPLFFKCQKIEIHFIHSSVGTLAYFLECLSEFGFFKVLKSK